MKMQNVADIYPLSPLQGGILFESLYADAGSGLYVEQFSYRLTGPLDAAAFRRAWQTLVDRHAVLRTAFFWDGLKNPLQVVHKRVAVTLAEQDWRDRAPSAQDEAFHALRGADRQEGFRPDQVPLMRLTLIRLADDAHYFLWSHHHLLLDGWCIPTLVGELVEAYNAEVAGRAPVLPPVRPYRDYIQWVEKQDRAAADAYWRDLLAGVEAPTPLLANLPPSATPDAGYGYEELTLTADLSASLADLAQRGRITLNTVFQGAWALLLARYCNLDEVVFGATVSGRPPELRGVEGMVGLFINTLPVRIDIPEGEMLLPWLGRLMAQQREQDAYAYSSLADVQRVADLPGGTALFETLFVFENFPVSNAEASAGLAGGLRVETLAVAERTNYPLTVAVLPGREIGLRLYHDRGQIDAATVRRLAGHFATLLTEVARDPDREPLRIPLLPPAERQALRAPRSMPAAFPPACIHRLFEAQAARRPDASALVCVDGFGMRRAVDGELTYGVLNARANRLAHHLSARGVGPDVRVGLCLDPSADLIVAILAILKAGGCYVPVDPEHPADRQAFVLSDCDADLLVTDAALAARLPATDAVVIRLDADRGLFEHLPETNLGTPVEPHHLAYVIYTSGSTGRPKGVLVEHRNVSRLFAATDHWFGFGDRDVWTLFHSFAFDFSVWEIWGALLHGGRLVVLPYLLSRAPLDFHRMLRREGVTVLNQTPSAFGQLIQADAELAAEASGLSLRTVIFGGEALDHAALAPWFARHPEDAPRLVNMYGITETTVHVTYRPVRAADTVERRSLIGEPIPDLRLHVLDRYGEPVPPGLPGELHVGGAGVARGYLNRPELTAERFPADPFASAAAAGSLYRTGDLVRAVLGADGAVVDMAYLGRADDQVKVRGFRIETGEVRAAILGHPGVADCVVLAEAEAETGGSRLVAYLVPEATQAAPVLRRLAAGSDATATGADTTLPNGLPVAHLNRSETTFLYREIFEDRVYLRHGIALASGDIVFDVGANIGLFALFAAEACGHDVTVYAFEPAAPAYEVLRRNFDLHGIPGEPVPLGISDRNGEGALTFFPRMSIMSGCGVRLADAQAAVLAYEAQRDGGSIPREVLDYSLEHRELPAHFITLSDAVRRFGVDRIDLLKIDVENAEQQVLAGLDPADWMRVRQIVIEVHDTDGRASAIETLLRSRGFEVAAERDRTLGDGSPLVNLYARRPGASRARPAAAQTWRTVAGLVSDVRESLKSTLPAYMIPAEFVPVAAIPLTRNGKTDRRALERLSQRRPAEAVVCTPPADETEQLLAGIWRAVLAVDPAQPIGRDDGFFELGGHSLLATRVMSRIRETFALDLPIRELFEHPTVARLAERIALFRRETATGGARAVTMPAVVADPDGRHEPFPLTEIQQAYWLGRNAGFELGNVSTHGYMEADCPDLDLGRFERAWQALVARHDMLRMVILPDGRQQVRADVPPYRIAVEDLRGSDAAARVTALASTRAAMSHQILPAETGPLFDIRASLLEGGVTRLHIGIDALWGDAHSLRVLVAELFQLYRDPDAVLPALGIGFRDYVLAEEQWRRTEWYADSLRYWRERLPDFPPAPDLPLATSPASLTTPRFRRHAGTLNAEAWSALKRRAGQAGLTPSGMLLAAFADILAFWSKSPRFTINLTLFNRHPVHPDVNRVVGDFTSLILLAVDNTPTDTFEARAKRLQRQLWRDLDHRYVNGVTVLRELARLRGGGGSAQMPVVFTSTLGLDAGAGGAAPIGDVVYSITQTSQVWLDHKVSERGGVLHFEWDAIEELFPAGMLDDMFDAYHDLLVRLAAEDAAWRESNAARLPPAGQLALRAAVNATAAPVPEGLLHTLWLDRWQDFGERPAVVAADRTLSHAALAGLVYRTGRLLRREGAARDRLVAIVMEKGWQQPVAALGILVSGAAYVPIDPELPHERLHHLLEQSGAAIVLTQRRFADTLDWPDGLRIVAVDGGDLDGIDDALLPSVQAADDLAYVIFTSGSTGSPKGVAIDHRGALNTVADINRRFDIGPDDRVLSLSALTFDLSVWDIFGVLAAGGAVVMPDPARRREPGHWIEAMEAHGVTVWNTVPALMQMLVDHVEERGIRPPPGLRVSMMSGDWIPLPLPDRIASLWPDCRRISLGGATEASIWSIWHPIETVDPAWTSIPYGRPLANQTFHVLDAHLSPRPAWVPGELFIGGIGLAREYWRDPAKTAAAFVSHPATGERLYRTGDLGRWRPDGSIEFLGREDQQIKLRGYRIELGEIEAALLQHPRIREAVVGVYGERHAGQRLIAHVVLEAERDASPDVSPEQAGDALLDPVERLQFKLGAPGLRPDAAGLAGPVLASPPRDEALTALWQSRRSQRSFAPDPVPGEGFGRFLSCLMAVDLGGAFPKYRYASAGNLYPVQTYVAVKAGRVEGLAGGVYYHHPVRHQLLLVSDREIGAEAFGPPGGFNRTIFEGAAFVLCLVARPAAMRPLYGDLTRDFCLLEAGYMSQLLMQEADAHGLGLCPIGAMNFDAFSGHLRLDADQILLHALVGGCAAPETAGTEDDLAAFLGRKLPAYMVPSAFVVLDALPLTANGKVDRAALAAPDAAAPGGGFTAPRDWLEHELMRLWQGLLERGEPIGVEDNFFDLGGNSLLAARLATQLLKRFQCQLLLTDLFRSPTLAEQADLLRGRVAPRRASSLVPMRTDGDRAPFFCFPGSGGHALYLYHLARHMPADRPFYALQPMAVDGESAPLTSVEAMAEHYLGLIREVQPHGPYLLGGHSLGAKVALEAAQQLLRDGEAVASLAVFDSVPFFTGEIEGEGWDDLRWLAALVRAAAAFGGLPVPDAEAELAPLSDTARVGRVKTHLERSGFLPAGSSPRQVRAMVDVFRANTQANCAYLPRATRPVPVMLFSPAAQPAVEREAMAAAWRAVGPVDLQATPGTHLTMMAEPHVRDLAALLALRLREGR